MNLAFFASGAGSGMRAVHDAIAQGGLEAKIVLLIANRPEAAALDFAARQGLPRQVIAPEREARACAALEEARADLILLSGYLKKVGPRLLRRFGPHILNMHPALLPRFGGAGFYGRRVHEAVLAAGETQSGASLHIVTGDYDRGPIIAQARVPVRPGDGPQQLEARVKACEARLWVAALQALCAGRITLTRTGSGRAGPLLL